jgi:hypothetical protein
VRAEARARFEAGNVDSSGSQLNRIFPVFADLDGKSFDPESVAAAVCIVMNVKGDQLESAHGLPVVGEEIGTETDMGIGGGPGRKRQPATQEKKRGSVTNLFHEFSPMRHTCRSAFNLT